MYSYELYDLFRLFAIVQLVPRTRVRLQQLPELTRWPVSECDQSYLAKSDGKTTERLAATASSGVIPVVSLRAVLPQGPSDPCVQIALASLRTIACNQFWSKDKALRATYRTTLLHY